MVRYYGYYSNVLRGKSYEIDPLECPKCAGQMRVIAFIKEMDVIRKILKHLELYDDRRRPVPTANSPSAAEFQYTIEDVIPQPMT